MRELHLFAGAGGGILGGLLLGHTPVCAVEIDPYCQEVLRARQRDGFLPEFPIHGDIRTFDGTPWAGRVDVVAGGWPCQDISVAGKGAGIGGSRSGLWEDLARIVFEVRPRYVFVENSPALVRRGLRRVLGDLAEIGYDARWTVLGAHHVSAPHRRERLWILANTQSFSERGGLCPSGAPEERRGRLGNGCCQDDPEGAIGGAKSRVGGMADGMAPGMVGCAGVVKRTNPRPWPAEPRDVPKVLRRSWRRIDRLRAIGNGQVPRVAAAAWRELMSWDVPA